LSKTYNLAVALSEHPHYKCILQHYEMEGSNTSITITMNR